MHFFIDFLLFLDLFVLPIFLLDFEDEDEDEDEEEDEEPISLLRLLASERACLKL